jgi:subtilisin
MKVKGKFQLVQLFTALFIVLGMLGSGSVLAAPAGSPYVIVFKDTVNAKAAAAEIAAAHGLQAGFVYEHALKGMAATVPAGRLEALKRDPRVAYVEADMLHTIDAQTVPTGIDRIFASSNGTIDIDGTDDFRVDVDVAVIDTGVDFQHPDLVVAGGVNCSGGSPFKKSCSSGGDDDHYHGTHVAGTIAAIDNGIGVVGVAPGARIWAVKVLSSSGSGYTPGSWPGSTGWRPTPGRSRLPI